MGESDMAKETEEEKLSPERAERFQWNADNCEVTKGDGEVLINLDDYFAKQEKK
jgi:hypothetical protein